MENLILTCLRFYKKLMKKCYILWNRYYLKLLIGKDNLGSFSYIHNKVYFRIASGSLIRIGDHFTFTSGENYNPLCRNIRGGYCG